MKAYVGLGANLGDCLATLDAAAKRLARLGRGLRVSPLVRTPPLLPPDAPAAWRLPFLNAVAELEWQAGAGDLMLALKRIEEELGRRPAERWAPRVLDLDLLALGPLELSAEGLRVPHPEAVRRSFVLDPWKELVPEYRIPGQGKSVLELSRSLSGRCPMMMGILNLTPDSFSDGGKYGDEDALASVLARWDAGGVQALDLGAESTRPGARLVSAEEEWARLAPALAMVRERYRGKWFRPVVSVDTRNAITAERALEAGCDLLNDVSGGADPAMLALARYAPRGIVLMHSLTVPADPKVVLDPGLDPVAEVRKWAVATLEKSAEAGLGSGKVLLDPGLGFGKSAAQSFELVKRFRELTELPARWLAGHSRKSFLQGFGARDVSRREGFSLGVSFHLAGAGADWLRVHDPALHKDALDARRECEA